MRDHQPSLGLLPCLCTFRRSGRRRDRRDPPTRCRPTSPRQAPPCRPDRKPHTHSGRRGCSLLLTRELLFEGERGVSHSWRLTPFTVKVGGRHGLGSGLSVLERRSAPERSRAELSPRRTGAKNLPASVSLGQSGPCSLRDRLSA